MIVCMVDGCPGGEGLQRRNVINALADYGAAKRQHFCAINGLLPDSLSSGTPLTVISFRGERFAKCIPKLIIHYSMKL
jgi:hypothetical protein